MKKLYILVDRLSDWAPYYPTNQVIETKDYLKKEIYEKSHATVINLSNDLTYLSEGYYCSLLAEAKQDKVMPAVEVINDLANYDRYQLIDSPLNNSVHKELSEMAVLAGLEGNQTEIEIKIFFGHCEFEFLSDLTHQIFDQYRAPILVLTFQKHHEIRWRICNLKLGSLSQLSESEQDCFANYLDLFSKKVWRKAKTKPNFRYELAILHNPDEPLPPSNKTTLAKFIKAGRNLGVDVDLITPDDYGRLAEYDGLFIRETTSLDHHTYHFAKQAQALGLPVIDSPETIIRCTNKVYLNNLLAYHGVPTPESLLLFRTMQSSKKDFENLFESLVNALGLPLVLKIPDGSFSRGVKKAENKKELENILKELFEHSAVVLAQKYYYTDYDWRIGVLNDRPIYACQYFMAKNHWQIVNHKNDKAIEGAGKTFGIHQVPKDVIRVALKATRLMGNDLYGVDIKVVDGKAMVIEVNDNPSINTGCEDAYLGDELYRLIIDEFVRRLDLKKTLHD